MTQPAPKTIEREKDKLYLNDAELIRRLGVPEKVMRSMLPGLESKFGFPRKQPLFGNRRYWPAVKTWLDKHNGLPVPSTPAR
ncbi:MAG: winged helix-turn-helix domain-containing protein [Bradyrhizobium sp.]